MKKAIFYAAILIGTATALVGLSSVAKNIIPAAHGIVLVQAVSLEN